MLPAVAGATVGAMYDRLGIINHCLLNTGNNDVAVEDDGSSEWLVASSAYDYGVKYLDRKSVV